VGIVVAQTNLQLYCQIRQAGASRAEILQIQKDYETACLLFGAICRSTGRPFLCHAVGTASVSLIEGAGFLDVRAALLHAAYKHGLFPDGKKNNTPKHRAWLSERTGGELAALLGEFSRFSFSLDDVRAYLGKRSLPDDLTLRLIRLKMANDVDDSHAFGAVLGHKSRYQDPTWLTLRRELSEKLGFDFCAKAFALAISECDDAGWLDTETVFARQGNLRSIPHQILKYLKGGK
jgi:hypothetical protein